MAADHEFVREIALTSVANPRVKDLVRLRTRRTRDERGVTLVEGHDELRLALAPGWAADPLLGAGPRHTRRRGVVHELADAGVPASG